MSGAVALPSVGLRDPVFISDLHLTQGRPRTVERFLRLVQGLAGAGRELVILGDLFEYWAGDEEAGAGIGATVCTALRSLRDRGSPVYVMHGNRDVLLGEGFARAAGAAFLADPCRVELCGVPTLLSHGDAYCTLDRPYQAFRRRARDPFWQRLFLALPARARHALIGRMRRLSESGKKTMAPQIMDVTPEAIEQALRSSGTRRMIHGHTHRPAVHRLAVDGQSVERWVLPDWEFDAAAPRGGTLQVVGGQLAMFDPP